ncbi:hypothetical protein L6R52_09600 [Myxococcota bacterium]|nr:hypothetical protein [Myxococcota bacterium]
MSLVPMTLDAGTVMSLSSLIPGTRRLFDPFKEPEKLREQARHEYVQNREVAAVVEDKRATVDRQMALRATGTTGGNNAPMVGATASEGAVSLASIKPIMVR